MLTLTKNKEKKVVRDGSPIPDYDQNIFLVLKKIIQKYTKYKKIRNKDYRIIKI